jgi:hypothetical protein
VHLPEPNEPLVYLSPHELLVAHLVALAVCALRWALG